MAEDTRKPTRSKPSPTRDKPAPRPDKSPPPSDRPSLLARLKLNGERRFWVLVVLIPLAALLTRINACDERQIASSVLEDPRISELIPRNDDLSRRLEALDQLPTVLSKIDGVDGKADQLAGKQDQILAELRTTRSLVQQVIEHSWTRTYTFDPASEGEPSPARLGALRAAVRSGAEVMVVHGSVDAGARLVSTRCHSVTIDTSENVLCMGAVVPANLELPDGRRYQETLRHDGTLTFSHWNADGTNVQGGSHGERQRSIWFVRKPF